MLLTLVIIYFLLLCALGLPFVKRLKLSSSETLAFAFLIGSIITGFYMFLVIQLKLVNWYYIVGFVLLSFIVFITQLKNLLINFSGASKFYKNYLFSNDKCSWIFICIVIVLLIWILALAYTPPHTADAMRYHLAQLQDIVNHHGYLFRPYLHYHFPMYFGYLFLPIFMFVKGAGIKLSVCVYFLLSILILERIAYKIELKSPRFLFLLIFLYLFHIMRHI